MMNGFFQCVPYLISMCTDTEKVIRVKADQQLQEIDKKYPGFIHVSLADRDNKKLIYFLKLYSMQFDGGFIFK